MIELTEDNIYKVRNFAKHQNIKVKEKNKLSVKEENIKNKESEVSEEIKEEKTDSNNKEPEVNIIQNKNDNLKVNEGENKKSENISDLMVNNKDIIVTDGDNNENNSLENSVPISLEVKRNNKVNNKKKKDNSSNIGEEIYEDNTDICGFTEDEYVLNPGERVLNQWSF